MAVPETELIDLLTEIEVNELLAKTYKKAAEVMKKAYKAQADANKILARVNRLLAERKAPTQAIKNDKIDFRLSTIEEEEAKRELLKVMKDQRMKDQHRKNAKAKTTPDKSQPKNDTLFSK